MPVYFYWLVITVKFNLSLGPLESFEGEATLPEPRIRLA